MYHQRSVPSFGGHARDVYPQGRISTKNGSEWSKDASCVITIRSQLGTCCGNAPMREMSGLCSGVQSRSAEMKWTIFSYCSRRCNRDWVHLIWRNGQSRPGQYGMPGIVSTLSRYRFIQRISLTAQWDYWKKRISTPKCSAYSVPRKEYFCQFCFSWDITVFI